MVAATLVAIIADPADHCVVATSAAPMRALSNCATHLAQRGFDVRLGHQTRRSAGAAHDCIVAAGGKSAQVARDAKVTLLRHPRP